MDGNMTRQPGPAIVVKGKVYRVVVHHGRLISYPLLKTRHICGYLGHVPDIDPHEIFGSGMCGNDLPHDT
eukprot:scaffold4052_cov213-Amphora_coffeaeformis.AAC.10